MKAIYVVLVCGLLGCAAEVVPEGDADAGVPGIHVRDLSASTVEITCDMPLRPVATISLRTGLMQVACSGE
jgi:hypothetical protein